MTVVNPKSISGINSITTASGADNLLTIHTNNGTERLRVDSTGTTKIVTGIVTTLTATTGIVTTLTTNTLTANSTAKVGSGVTLSPDGDIFATGVTTATTFSGSGASLTNLPAANLTGALPAISGANLTGLSQVGGAYGVDFNDDTKARFGNGNDLEIWHSSNSNSYIKNSTGELKLASDNIALMTTDQSEKFIDCNGNGNVELYYDNSKKFETTTDGTTVTGNLKISDTAFFESSDNFYLDIQSGNNDFYIRNGTTTRFSFKGSTGKIEIGDNTLGGYPGVSIKASDLPTVQLWDDQNSDNFVMRYRNSNQRVELINNHNGVHLDRGGTSFGSLSDERSKDIVSNITGGFDKIKGLRTVIGNYKTDPDKYQKPFLIAQDVQAVLPEAVSTRDPDNLTLCYTEVIPLLTNALQEAIVKIEVLETRLNNAGIAT